MADYKIVDGEKLDQDLTSVANAIREKSGDSGSLAFPSGFVSAISSISNVATLKVFNGNNIGNTDVIYLDENGVTQRVSPGQTKTIQAIGGILVYPYVGDDYICIELNGSEVEQNDSAGVYWIAAVPDGSNINVDV